MKKSTIAGVVVVILHLVGLVGMLVQDWAAWMLVLTPLNLLIVAILTISFQKEKPEKYWYFVLFAFILGFSVEVLGVHTGWPFGTYRYGATLGAQVWGVPLTIGLNWLVLTLCTASVFRRVSNNILAAAGGAFLMLAIDFLIEPVASRYDYWHWAGEQIPVENYISWGVVAFILHLSLRTSGLDPENRIAKYVLAGQVLFFLGLNFFEW